MHFRKKLNFDAASPAEASQHPRDTMADEAAIPLNPNRQPAKGEAARHSAGGCTTLETTEGPMPLSAVLQRCSPAATTVAIVSISLSIALGIASGAGPQAGLSTAVWGGMTGGLFCSSPYNIIGPAGALAPILNSYSVQWGPGILPWISLGSAVVIFATYATSLQKYMLYMPKAVFEGFTVAVAITIGFSQLPAAFGLTVAKHAHFLGNLFDALSHMPEAKLASTAVFLPEFLAMFFLLRAVPVRAAAPSRSPAPPPHVRPTADHERPPPHPPPPLLSQRVPWMAVIPLASLPLGWIGEAWQWGLPTLKSKYGQLSPDLLSPPSPAVLAALPPGGGAGVVAAILSVAAVAVLETLISAKIAADRAGVGFDEATETRGLALAHAVCGLAGAMPPTGVFVRTNLNQSLGAVHRAAQFLQAALVGVVTLCAMPLFQFMPMPTIAAVLAVAAARMLPWGYLAELWAHDRADFYLCALTATLAVASDMIVGLLVGTVVALLRNAAQVARAPNTVQHAADGGGGGGGGGGGASSSSSKAGAGSSTAVLTVSGAVTYVNAREVLARGLACPSATSDGDAPRALLDCSGVLAVDGEGLAALHALLLALDRHAADGAVVKGPSGVETAAAAVKDKYALRPIVTALAPAAFVLDRQQAKPGEESD